MTARPTIAARLDALGISHKDIDAAFHEVLDRLEGVRASNPRRIIGEAIGEASLLWEPKPTGVFNSTEGAALIDRTMALLNRG